MAQQIVPGFTRNGPQRPRNNINMEIVPDAELQMEAGSNRVTYMWIYNVAMIRVLYRTSDSERYISSFRTAPISRDPFTIKQYVDKYVILSRAKVDTNSPEVKQALSNMTCIPSEEIYKCLLNMQINLHHSMSNSTDWFLRDLETLRSTYPPELAFNRIRLLVLWEIEIQFLIVYINRCRADQFAMFNIPRPMPLRAREE
ncbi:unnamed protein product [Caenorhabditis bovis]|uniref:Uncharacterized protein n=1 Tax=Caenorhabditis bovis TaxID=2654633 RepID=A0A8S1FEF8_9PELO|nr:unnamed protein product [Caenorhabditis bovis]